MALRKYAKWPIYLLAFQHFSKSELQHVMPSPIERECVPAAGGHAQVHQYVTPAQVRIHSARRFRAGLLWARTDPTIEISWVATGE